MNIAEASIKRRTITLVFTALIVVGGIMSYGRLGRLEDPAFTIKEAQVLTSYPGATAMEVAEEVTDKVETAVQQMNQIKLVTSTSEPGRSTVLVEMEDKYDQSSLPQVWDELRRKVNDMQGDLPPGAGPSVVNDDFGDVYGMYVALYGDGYTDTELYEYAKTLRRELLLAEDVGKIALFGVQHEAIFVEISRARLAQLGIAPSTVYQALSGQNLVAPAGRVEVDSKFIRIQPSGEFTSVEDIGDLLILQNDKTATTLYLRDLATIERGYVDPPTHILRFNGRSAVGLGISTRLGGNVVTMGNSLMEKFRSLEAQTPIGIEFGPIALQSEAVTTAINGFVVSLIQAILIVIAVLIFAMGFRSSLIIGAILLLTILATFIFMDVKSIMLERISLGALIIALGMLVDNAIVVVEGILINSQKGMTKTEAASKIVQQTMWPLFGATVVAVLAFAAIGASQDSTGEYCRSLFQVILISLMLSWVLAITVTPLFGLMFLKTEAKKPGEEEKDPYGGTFFLMYRKLLTACIRKRWITVPALIAALAASVVGFGYVRQSFFPPSTRPQFMVHHWLPQGTHISRTDRELTEIAEFAMDLEGVTDVATIAGHGGLRFLLTYAPENTNSAYGFSLVSVEDASMIDDVIEKIDVHVTENYPDAQSFARRFQLGPGESQKIQVRFRGKDPNVLRVIAREATRIMEEEPTAVDIVDDWRHRMAVVRPIIAETQMRNAGLTRGQVAEAIQAAFEGQAIGQYRERDELLPIIARSPEIEREDIENLRFVQVWSPAANRSIPLSQIVLGFETVSENALLQRRNRLPTITVKCDPKVGEANTVLEKLRPKIESRFDEMVEELDIDGYSLEWGGEYEDSGDAQAALAGKMPMIFLAMVLVVICLFNSIGQPLVIFMTVPLALIGVTVGLLVMDQPFGFMALLGFLSLVGMLIKNAIVLIDEINLQLSEGKPPFQALIDSGTSRLRPVSMAALTTVLGMVPLLADAFFSAMAVTIMFGLTFATILTLVVVPVLYAIVYRVKNPEKV